MYDITPVTSEHPTDCGATCLKMLLDYYEIDVPLDQLVKECNTRLIGCTAADVLRAGRLHGQEMHAYKTDLDGILKVDRPAIVWWKRKHFCILCGVDDAGNIVIINPDRGRYRMSKSLFKCWYSGIALFIGEPVDIDGVDPVEVYNHVVMP